MNNPIKEKILNVANKVIAEKGLNCFTLEEVAKEAGISKGGLLYHYPSKDQLIEGLIQNYLVGFENKVTERAKDQLEESSYGWLISFIQEQFSLTSSKDSNIISGLLAAAVLNKELLDPFMKKRKDWIEKIKRSNDPIIGLIVSFVCDGIVFSNLLGVEVISEDVKEKVLERLVSLIKVFNSNN